MGVWIDGCSDDEIDGWVFEWIDGRMRDIWTEHFLE